MTPTSDPDLLLLLGLRLKNFVEADALAEMWDRPEADTEVRLQALADGALAQHREGRVSGWSLTAEGRAVGEQRLAEELDAADARDDVEQGYRSFLDLNRGFLGICTRWQVRDPDANLLNEHDDPDYDAAVVAELAAMDGRVQPICGALAEALDRFGGFGPRFGTALARVHGGENDWFAKPLIDSYHTVWFDLHETLLATLGLDRASEASPAEGER